MKNKGRNGKYWVYWSKCRRWMLEHGRTPAQAEDMRHKLQFAATGKHKSSKDLSRHEFDATIAKFESYFNGGDLDAQLRPEIEAARRTSEAKLKIHALAAKCGIEGGETGLERYFKNWFGTRTVAKLNEDELAQLIGLLDRRAAQINPAPADEDDGDPF